MHRDGDEDSSQPADADSSHVREMYAFLDAMIENLPNMVFLKDAAELRFVRLNRAAEELLGIPRSELLGKNDYDFFPESEADFFTQKDREVLAAGQMVEIEAEPIQTRNLGARLLHTKKIPLFDDAGKPAYLLGISEDVTDRVESQQAIRHARDEAEAANHAKSEFLARMSHELRTPLNAILGFAQLLERSASEEQQEIVGPIIKSGRHLLQLINEVLDISQIEAGRLAMSLDSVDVWSVVEEACSIIAPSASERSVVVETVRDGRDPCVMADRRRLLQVIVNLCANAVKYNKPGGRVTVSVRESTDTVAIAIADTGSGIDPGRIEELFAPFSRLDASEEIEGTGLGLFLSKRLVEAMNGTINARSVRERGTTLTVEIPVADMKPSPDSSTSIAGHVTRQDEDKLRVLYIEDNISNIQLMRATCRLWPGVALEVAMDGVSGLNAATDSPPDLVLLDLHLPDMSGHEVLRQLKGASITAGVPVVILSANAMPNAMQETMRQGAVAYLTKPFEIDQLLRVIEEHALRERL